MLDQNTSISTEEKLDIILQRIKDSKPMSCFDMDFTCNLTEYDAFMKHLTDKDKLIEFDHENTLHHLKIYRLTIKGMFFEGYVNRKNRLDTEKSIQNIQTERQKNMFYLTLILTAGVLGILFLEALKFLLDYLY